MLEAFVAGLLNVFTVPVLPLMLLGIAVGFAVGILPGIGSPVAMALMLPFDAPLTLALGIAFLIAFVVCGVFLIAEPGFLEGTNENDSR